jgi:Transposase IS116/IS110/IS902 family
MISVPTPASVAARPPPSSCHGVDRDRPELAAAVGPLLKAREAIEQQIADFDRKVMRLARNDAQVRRFMTTPGIGAITALCFLATIDDPTRFKRSRSVGAYVGLTTRRYASGVIDWTGRISKCGDKMLRSYLYEAANVLLTRVAKWSTLKAWGVRAKRAPQSQGCCRSKTCRHPAPDVGRWYRVQLVIEGDRSTRITHHRVPAYQRETKSLPGRWRW